jgi:hypothetical protein
VGKGLDGSPQAGHLGRRLLGPLVEFGAPALGLGQALQQSLLPHRQAQRTALGGSPGLGTLFTRSHLADNLGDTGVS